MRPNRLTAQQAEQRELTMLRHAVLTGLLAITAAIITVQIKTPTTQPACTDKAESEPIRITVKSVAGVVEKRDDDGENSKWVHVKAGQTLRPSASIRTGLGAHIMLKFGESNNYVVIGNETSLSLSRYDKNGKKTRPIIGMKHRSIRKLNSPHVKCKYYFLLIKTNHN